MYIFIYMKVTKKEIKQMKNILAENMLRFGPRNLSESEKRNLQKLVEQTEPGDPSQATVDLTSDITSLKTACMAFNNDIKNKLKIDTELITSVTPEGMIAGSGPYVTITSPIFQKIYGTNRPYGFIGVELSKGYYGVHFWGTTGVKQVSLQNLIISIKNLTAYIARGGETDTDKGTKFNEKYHAQIVAATTTLFNTVDPIFKKLLKYKGYNSATTLPSGEVTISKTV